MRAEQLAVSPCSTPDLDLDAALAAFARLGFRKFEAFTEWTKSAPNVHGDPAAYLDTCRQYGLACTSLHLPRIGEDLQAGLREALAAARTAAALGVKVVIFKAASREHYLAAARPFLDGIEGLGVIPAVQNHVNTPIATLGDYRAVLDGINDPRLRAVLEVGMFCSVGVQWPEACAALGDRIALVHLKDQIGDRRVPFGTGAVDFAGLFRHLDARDYRGEYVLEMEVNIQDVAQTLRLLGEARAHLLQFEEEAAR